MSWHLITMIILSILYLGWKIYLYSTSITFNYWKNQSQFTKSEWRRIKRRRFIKESKYIFKGYWRWYKLDHVWPIVIAWMIYGGIFIW